ncbi:exodeoxyribonuclease VII large subunit [Vogesella indigofera]|uniref:exodeoxyribonuclease VII large subunit n=1 Tax=Vogesella indigofera TaxID=45465 RepID=UPI00234EC407|nr:exodeoxyribonuclease VII large subunit [Vogesella indigofera]MDC7699224.1 exodeoxyribonuclease VII large subunit [Vogesella indigofera]
MLFSQHQNDVISVTSLNRMARDLLESGLPPMWIAGEISNLTLAASGHAYFSLKDERAQIRCVMFRNRLSGLGFRLQEGMQVELRGTVSLYEARGDYQINVDMMRSAGLGRLYEAFEQLKAKLAAEGLFDNHHKKALPGHPAAIGIVTSPAAAALRDVVTTLRRRMPSIPLILYPTPVQGDSAAAQIAAAIDAANLRQEVELLIVCRGGGSIEDLWAFNEEVVARAIARSTLPVISGVGHETDTTIADFVADHRAPTPTAAAELASPSREALQQGVDYAQRRLERALGRLLTDKSQQLDFLGRRLQHPGERLQRQRQLLQAQQQRLARASAQLLQARQRRLEQCQHRLQRIRPDLARWQQVLARRGDQLRQLIHRHWQQRQLVLARHQATLAAINPEAVLQRGYAIVQQQDGSVVRSAAQLRAGELLHIRLAEGETTAVVGQQQGQQSELPF